jgi:hypothetical protein
MSAVPAKPAPPGQRAHQKNKPRPIDFYRPLPFCRPKGKNDFKYVSITAAGRSLVTVSRQKLEAGLFEGVTTYDKAIRLNVPTPSYQDVEDYDQLVPEQGPLPRAFLRSKPPKRSTLPKVPGEKAEAALALGRPLGAAPPADMSGNPACAESDDEPEYVLGADDERWLRETLPDAVRKKLGAGARAEAQKGRSHKKGAGKAAQLEQQKAEEERRKREEAEKRAALAAQPATRGKKSKEEDLVQVLMRRPSNRARPGDHPRRRASTPHVAARRPWRSTRRRRPPRRTSRGTDSAFDIELQGT